MMDDIQHGLTFIMRICKRSDPDWAHFSRSEREALAFNP